MTGLGKLVALSRESIDRERRWYESMYKTMVSDQSREFARAVERSEMVLDIRRRIALERDRIYSLVNETERSQSLGLNREAPR
mgnify:FL=1